MRELNPRALIFRDPADGAMTMIEHVMDSPKDRRLYTIEIKATDNGKRAVGFCRFSPWGKFRGGAEYHEAHVDTEGFICVGHGAKRQLLESPFALVWVVKRCRYWPIGYSYYREHGVFLNP